VLRDLKLKAVYRTETDSLLEDFYIPALSVSSSYDRAVGFFNASMLSFAAQGISALIKGRWPHALNIRWNISPEDAIAIERGYDLRTFVERFGVEFSKTVDQIAEDLTRQRLEALSWMVANGTLDIKVAFRQHGMYHEKIGILRDQRGDCVVFQGSANETASALLPDFNFKSVNVFPCWREELKDHFEPYLKGFELLWNNESRNTIVIDFPDAAKEKLIRIAKTLTHVPSPEVETDLWQKLLTRNQSKSKFYHQLPITVNGQPFIIKQHQSDVLPNEPYIYAIFSSVILSPTCVQPQFSPRTLAPQNERFIVKITTSQKLSLKISSPGRRWISSANKASCFRPARRCFGIL
jgi:hypothetical protein